MSPRNDTRPAPEPPAERRSGSLLDWLALLMLLAGCVVWPH